jgi:response regulator NasT
MDRAKGRLMQRQGLTEQAAFAKRRKAAMDKGRKRAVVAQRLLDMADRLG